MPFDRMRKSADALQFDGRTQRHDMVHSNGTQARLNLLRLPCLVTDTSELGVENLTHYYVQAMLLHAMSPCAGVFACLR